ncbi:MAG: ABC transporter transmembrane domain-containing protein, partial [Acidobacteriota bacterium]
MNHYHEEDFRGKAYDSRLGRRLLKYLYPYRWTVATSIFLLLLVSGLQLVGPYLTKVAIDQYISTGDGDGLTYIAVLFLLVLLFQFAVSFAQTYLMNWTGQKIMYDLRMQIFAHIQKLDMGYFDRNPIGRLITRMTTDVDVLNELFTAGVVSIFGDIFSLAGARRGVRHAERRQPVGFSIFVVSGRRRGDAGPTLASIFALPVR